MSEGIIVALIGLLGTVLGAGIGAFTAIIVAQSRSHSESKADNHGRRSSCAIIGLFATITGIVGLVLGVLFATQIVQTLFSDSEVTYVISVPADIVWYNTQIQVNSGQVVDIIATGSVATWESEAPESISGPDGQAATCPDVNNPEVINVGCLMNSEPYGALVGRIGDSAPFLVGSVYSDESSTNGTLFLAVNDHYPFYEDNHGAYSVSVTIKPAP